MRSAADVWPRAVLIYLIYRKASIGRRSVMWHIGSRLIGKYVKLTSARAVRLFACAARRGTKVRLRNGKPPQLRSSKFLRQTYKSVSQKFPNPQFRRLLRHFCVINPRLSAAKPSGFFLELTQNPLELADFPF